MLCSPIQIRFLKASSVPSATFVRIAMNCSWRKAAIAVVVAGWGLAWLSPDNADGADTCSRKIAGSWDVTTAVTFPATLVMPQNGGWKWELKPDGPEGGDAIWKDGSQRKRYRCQGNVYTIEDFFGITLRLSPDGRRLEGACSDLVSSVGGGCRVTAVRRSGPPSVGPAIAESTSRPPQSPPKTVTTPIPPVASSPIAPPASTTTAMSPSAIPIALMKGAASDLSWLDGEWCIKQSKTVSGCRWWFARYTLKTSPPDRIELWIDYTDGPGLHFEGTISGSNIEGTYYQLAKDTRCSDVVSRPASGTISADRKSISLRLPALPLVTDRNTCSLGNSLQPTVTELVVIHPNKIKVAPVLSAISLAAPTAAKELYTLDNQIGFNVLDQVEYDPQSGKINLVGHVDLRYETKSIPYLQYLATLLEGSSPEFSLEWTGDSERRVNNLRQQLNSDAEWKRLAGEWGRWVDDSDRITPAGRILMPIFGVQLPEAGNSMNVYQLLSGVYYAIENKKASRIMDAFGEMRRRMPNLTRDDLTYLTREAGISSTFSEADKAVREGRSTKAAAMIQIYRALALSFDDAFDFPNQPCTRTVENSIRRRGTSDAAADAILDDMFTEFDRQIKPAYGEALRKLMRRPSEVQVPISLINSSLQGTLNIAPKYIGIDRNSALAKLLFETDYLSKGLGYMPELADKIPGYETEYSFKLRNPAALRAAGGRVSSSRFWTSIDSAEISRSADGNILAFGTVKMRFNIRQIGSDGRDLTNQQPSEYEQLLTSLYDQFALNYSPTFHEAREAAKLVYVAEWLKLKDPNFKLPQVGRGSWSGPTTVPGIIFVSMHFDPTRPDVQSVSAIGGISLRIPPPGNGVCVKFCNEAVPIRPELKPANERKSATVIDCKNGVPGRLLGATFCAVRWALDSLASPAVAALPPTGSNSNDDGLNNCREGSASLGGGNVVCNVSPKSNVGEANTDNPTTALVLSSYFAAGQRVDICWDYRNGACPAAAGVTTPLLNGKPVLIRGLPNAKLLLEEARQYQEWFDKLKAAGRDDIVLVLQGLKTKLETIQQAKDKLGDNKNNQTYMNLESQANAIVQNLSKGMRTIASTKDLTKLDSKTIITVLDPTEPPPPSKPASPTPADEGSNPIELGPRKFRDK